MARCQRCYACENMWEFKNCTNCNFPGKDSRTVNQIRADNEYRKELEKEEDDD